MVAQTAAISLSKVGIDGVVWADYAAICFDLILV